MATMRCRSAHLRALLVLACAVWPCCLAKANDADGGAHAASIQKACWALDGAVTMAEHASQLSLAHSLLLNQSVQSPDLLTEELQTQLKGSLSLLTGLRQWTGKVTSGLKHIFTKDSIEPTDIDAHMLVQKPKFRLDVLESLSSSKPWSGQCEDVLVQPLMMAMRTLQDEISSLDERISKQSLEHFRLRAQRATAAGELQALEDALRTNRSTRMETVAGVSNVTKGLDKAIWRNIALRRQVVLALTRAFSESQHRSKASNLDINKAHRSRSDAARLVSDADVALLDNAKQLQAAIHERRDLAEKLRNHVKAMLVQCMPPASGAQRSRYTRFVGSGPRSNAVQLSLEVSNFISRAVSRTIPLMLDVMDQAAAEARQGANRHFEQAPSFSRWGDWLASPADGGEFLGFDAFAGRFKQASDAYDARLVAGGRLAALHSMWSRWEELHREYPIAELDDAAIVKENERPTVGFWHSLGF
eukprot:TRINITY_DN66036_c0_g1_i1.p1 TRINITY_DN66036_c0_g1~~TRINITY_DN66036_c0_g1_i1.p1  ORF type:complete len:487 (-),score=63.53 TRINITY_DN66036_c0_g1_i1:197-1618(-)